MEHRVYAKWGDTLASIFYNNHKREDEPPWHFLPAFKKDPWLSSAREAFAEFAGVNDLDELFDLQAQIEQLKANLSNAEADLHDALNHRNG